MALQASSDILIDASVEKIIDVLADIDALSSWSSVHKRAEVIDTHPDGRPHHVKVAIKVTGIIDTEILEYHWGPDWVVWDANRTTQQHGQHGEYNLTMEGEERTRVRFTMTVEPFAPLPEFWAKMLRKKILSTALEDLRKRVVGG